MARRGAAVVNEFRRASRRKFQVSFVTAVRSDQLTQILQSAHFQSKMKKKRNQLHYILVLFLVAISHANKSNPRYVASKKPRHMRLCAYDQYIAWRFCKYVLSPEKSYQISLPNFFIYRFFQTRAFNVRPT